jgi:hypothetical protein
VNKLYYDTYAYKAPITTNKIFGIGSFCNSSPTLFPYSPPRSFDSRGWGFLVSLPIRSRDRFPSSALYYSSHAISQSQRNPNTINTCNGRPTIYGTELYATLRNKSFYFTALPGIRAKTKF